MKLYLETDCNPDKIVARTTGHRRFRYAYGGNDHCIQNVIQCRHKPTKAQKEWEAVLSMIDQNRNLLDLMLDSGAFPAWTRGARISLEEYAQFILANSIPKQPRNLFNVVVNLDVIPGRPGQLPSAADIEAAAVQGWENWQRLTMLLKPTGLVPLHTYHYGEDVKWLTRLMAETDYLGLGGFAKGVGAGKKRKWLDEVFKVLTDVHGQPLVKVHGFGMTSLPLMLRYPWHSVDSTSWLHGRHGAIYLWLNGRPQIIMLSDRLPDEDETPQLLKAGRRARLDEVEGGRHFSVLTSLEQAEVRRVVEARGFTIKELSGDTEKPQTYMRRDVWNVQFFLELERSWIPRPFQRNETQAQLL